MTSVAVTLARVAAFAPTGTATVADTGAIPAPNSSKLAARCPPRPSRAVGTLADIHD